MCTEHFLMSSKGLLSPRREKPTQNSLCPCNLASGNPRMGPALCIQLVIVSVPTTYAKQSWSAEAGGGRAWHIAICCRHRHKPLPSSDSTCALFAWVAERSHRKPSISPHPHPCANWPIECPTPHILSPWLIHRRSISLKKKKPDSILGAIGQFGHSHTVRQTQLRLGDRVMDKGQLGGQLGLCGVFREAA